MNEAELMWVAGLLEGEGSFFTKTNSHTPIISCAMTDLDVLQRLSDLTQTVMPYKIARQQAHHRQAWCVKISGHAAADLMRILQPLMGERRRARIAEVLAIWDEKQVDIQARSVIRIEKAQAAADYYLTTPDIGLRAAATKFGVSHVTVKNYVDRAVAQG